MSIITILLFFVYCYGLGFTVSSFVKNSENFLERNLMRIGFGLSLLPFLALALNTVKLPADWKLILALSLVFPLYYLFRNYKKFNFSFKITKTNLSIFIMLIIFFVNFYIYGSGAFNYPYLENDDPWSHAFGVKFFSIEKNVFGQAAEYIRYINPYPPSYDILLGILHQTNDSVYWTMKFFNALIISLSTIFFYFFVKGFTGNRNKALFATFALFSIPAFMSHFIWGIALTVPLYFVVFYAVERIKYDKKWWVVAALAMVTVLTSSPTHSAYFGLFFILYVVAKMILERKILWQHIAAGAVGLSLSFIFWWLPMITRYGVKGTIQGFGYRFKYGTAGLGGTADRIYAFKDFFVAQMQNMINNPIGIGMVLSLLVVLALVFLLYRYWNSIKKYALVIIPLFFVLNVIAIVLLWKNYAGQLWGSKETLLEKGPISFSVFFSEQSFVVIGLTFMILVLVPLIYSSCRKLSSGDEYLGITLVWLIFSFCAVNASPYIYKLSPFRAWMLLAIPVCILAAEGIFNLMSMSKKSIGNIGKYVILILLLIGIFFTSTQQKIAVNTATWPPGGFWTSGEEIGAYVWMKDNLPKNSRVFTFHNNAPVIGMDMYTCHWCDDVRDYMENGFNESAQETYDWLKQNDYEYLIIDGQTVNGFGANESNTKIEGIAQSGLFQPVFQNQGAVIFKV